MPNSGEKYAIRVGASSTRAPGVPPLAAEVGVEVGLDRAQTIQEALVGGELLEPLGGHGAEQPDGVTLGRLPDLGVDLGEHVLGRRVPRPPQVSGEIGERREGRGQDRADGEPTDGAHPRTVAEFDLIVPIFGRLGVATLITADLGTRPSPCVRVARFERVMSMVGRIPVMDVMPLVDLGRLPAKATVDEPLPVTATVFREGHDKLGAEVVLVTPDGTARHPCA